MAQSLNSMISTIGMKRQEPAGSSCWTHGTHATIASGEGHLRIIQSKHSALLDNSFSDGTHLSPPITHNWRLQAAPTHYENRILIELPGGQMDEIFWGGA